MFGVFFSSHSRIDKLLLKENKVPRKLIEANKVAGSAKYEQSNTFVL